ncbi:MAG: hypothetical protein ACHQD9_03955 [Chitinophagales bacterium]
MKKTKTKKKAAKRKTLRKNRSKSSKKTARKKTKQRKTSVKKKSSSPKGKKKSSFKPNTEKLALLRQTFVTVLWRHEALPPERVREFVQQEIAHKFPTEFSEYFNHVNELLTRFNLIEEVPDKKPLHIRLVQRLEE